MTTPIDHALNQRIAAFAHDITEMLTRAVAASVSDALGARGTGKRRGRPPGSTSSSKRATGKAVSEEALLAEVKRKPELRMEELAKRLRTSTGALRGPMLKLLDDKKVKRSGQARGTKYRPA